MDRPTSDGRPLVGFSCAYTPLPLLDAAGFLPYRMLPLGAAPDQAGAVLHDNLCPHVKRILDRALASDLPPLAGVVLINSCDAMRRLADAWREVRPDQRLALLDLPSGASEGGVRLLSQELSRLRRLLSDWSGRPVTDEQLASAAERRDELARALQRLARRAAGGSLASGALQRAYNLSVTASPEQALQRVQALEQELEARPSPPAKGGVPLYLMGNVMPDPEALELLEACGARVVGDDLCTAGRQQLPLDLPREGELMTRLARALLQRPACARTIDPAAPGQLATQAAAGAERSGARGVIAHAMKFCDPYLARMPAVRQELERRGLPLLVLEGDCTLRSLGQHRTRIEAFIEMLDG
jgi:benzoyl-CoA reductase/2-hydroxyglutaryl-CoA dehydratase subunit BcrC/BadD/HgdB